MPGTHDRAGICDFAFLHRQLEMRALVTHGIKGALMIEKQNRLLSDFDNLATING